MEDGSGWISWLWCSRSVCSVRVERCGQVDMCLCSTVPHLGGNDATDEVERWGSRMTEEYIQYIVLLQKILDRGKLQPVSWPLL